MAPALHYLVARDLKMVNLSVVGFSIGKGLGDHPVRGFLEPGVSPGGNHYNYRCQREKISCPSPTLGSGHIWDWMEVSSSRPYPSSQSLGSEFPTCPGQGRGSWDGLAGLAGTT